MALHGPHSSVLVDSVAEFERIRVGIGEVDLQPIDGVTIRRWVDPLGIEWSCVDRGDDAPIPEEDAAAWDEVLSSVDSDLDRPHLATGDCDCDAERDAAHDPECRSLVGGAQ